MSDNKIAIFWFRRDLRIEDNTALTAALNSGHQVLPIFIFDIDILNKIEDKRDKRVDLIRQILSQLSEDLEKMDSSLLVKYGKPIEVFQNITKDYNIACIYTNRDYEPYAVQRDQEISSWASVNNITFKTFKDQVIFEPGEITKVDGNPYTVFTPYSKVWKRKWHESANFSTSGKLQNNFIKTKPFRIPELSEIGFQPTDYKYIKPVISESIIQQYHAQRDFPGIEGTSHLSVHLRFGTVSIRKLVQIALQNNETWLNELIWREFFIQIMWFFPFVEKRAFNSKYELIEWNKDEKLFKSWCEGQTGFPMVDAGMRELNTTGWMHNRVRMVTANFLTKILMIDWKWGEAYFAAKLLDFDLALNNGNWQWSAGSGCDAAPYFRIFNPTEQIKKFDPELIYIRKWVPEFESFGYVKPIIDYQTARNNTMEKFKKTFDSIKNT